MSWYKKAKKPKGKRFAPFKSMLEKNVSEKLPRAKWKYEPERLTYVLEKKYVPDFVITRRDGSKLYLEVKGYLRWEDQQKMKAVKAANPDLDIRLYFANDDKVQTSGMTNSEWAAK